MVKTFWNIFFVSESDIRLVEIRLMSYRKGGNENEFIFGQYRRES